LASKRSSNSTTASGGTVFSVSDSLIGVGTASSSSSLCVPSLRKDSPTLSPTSQSNRPTPRLKGQQSVETVLGKPIVFINWFFKEFGNHFFGFNFVKFVDFLKFNNFKKSNFVKFIDFLKIY
jgi:hypothetical protein